ncbi:MAG TPA: radical SAM protein [Chitinophagaceae bacterium]|nr:radical SAM protein [Chitinophagaceae bacterium]
MKILLTHGYFINEDNREQVIMKPYVPLGMLYISGFLEQHGYDNVVFDSTFSSFDQLCQTLIKQLPDVVGIYTNLMTKVNVLRVINFIKTNAALSKTRIVLGGPEVRNHARNFLDHGADFIVFGEGEQTMLELVQWLDGRSIKNIAQIEGIAFLTEKNEIKQNPERQKLKDLDVLPLPNRKKVNLQLYFDAWKSHHGTSAISINTMRGCPYTCKWCSRAVYGQSYRRRSPGNVVNEMEWIQKYYSVDTVWFVDDVFTISHKWLEEFAQQVKDRKLDFPYECITRADRMSEEVINLLRESGCFRVWIGAESGSQKVIDLMDRRVEVQQVQEMIQLSKRNGLQAGTFIMVGYPGETAEDIYATVRHLKKADPDFFTITIAYPIKGTELYAEVEDRFIQKLAWDKSTDRDIDFERTYNRHYYDHAIKMINNEIFYHKALKKPFANLFRLPVYKLKSTLAKSGMLLQQLKSKQPSFRLKATHF